MGFIPVNRLEPGMVLSEDIFAKESSVPFITRGTILSGAMIRSVSENGIDRVSIIEEEHGGIVTVKPPKPPIDPKLRGDALSNIEDLFLLAQHGDMAALSPANVIKEMHSVVNRLVDSLLNDKSALVNIAGLKSYDEYTYHHSLSVAVISVAIGDALNMKRDALAELGRSAMMHDIGKTSIPIEIINKPARLTNEEFSIVKEHSARGYKYLSENGIGSDSVWRSVLLHHEKIDGTGYPLNLKGGAIPLMSRVISIADVYDALTSQRPYRSPMPPSEALEYIMGGSDTAFDYDIVSSFAKKLELYPVGSIVELSNGKLGVVLANENLLRPVVKLLDTGEILDLYNDIRLLSVTVKCPVPQAPQ